MAVMLKSNLAVLCVFSGLALLPARAEERIDLGTIHQIKTEAFQNSKVMDTMFYLTDANGPRVTNSPGFFSAANWVVKQLQDWGLSARLEKWGPFGRGWTYTRFSAHLVEPAYAPLIGYPQAWTSSTNGVVTGEPMLVERLTNDADLDKWRGKLNGKIVLIGEPIELKMNMTAQGRRYSDSDLADLAVAPDPGANFGFRPPGRPGGGPEATRQFQTKLSQFLSDEHPLVIVRTGQGRSEGGTVFGGSAGSRELKDPVAPPTVVLTPEHYNRIARLLDHKIPVKLEVESETKFFDDRTDSVNVVGEIEGGPEEGSDRDGRAAPPR